MTVRVAHLSDIHFGGENQAATAAALRVVNERPLDLVIVSGDLTQFGEPAEFAQAAAWLGQINRPTLVTPGNHDSPYFAVHERLLAPFRRFEHWVGPAHDQAARAEGVVVAGVNTARGAQPRLNWSKGRIDRIQVKRALSRLDAAAEGSARVVVCHHPLSEMIGGPMTGRVWGGEAAARAFAEGGVDVVLSGHIHTPFVWPFPFGDGHTYAVGAGTLSVRERGAPAGFNLLDIEKAAIRVAALSWTGSHFEPFRTWSVDRR